MQRLDRSTRYGDARAPDSARVELLMTAVVLLLLSPIAFRSVSNSVSAARAEDAAHAVAADLQHALSLAQRLGTPVRVEFDPEKLELTIRDAGTGEELHHRGLGPGTDFDVRSATATVKEVEVFPDRTASGSIVITFAAPSRSTRVVMTPAAVIWTERL